MLSSALVSRETIVLAGIFCVRGAFWKSDVRKQMHAAILEVETQRELHDAGRLLAGQVSNYTEG
jgi:hypothetical protein